MNFNQPQHSLTQITHLLFGDRNYGLTKIKNTVNESVYACECRTMMGKDKHYLFVIGSIDVISIGANVRLDDIVNITCIQFRTFSEPIVQKVLVNNIDIQPGVDRIPIKRYNISSDNTGHKISEYMFEYNQKPYNVHLFHTTESDNEYMPDGNLHSAIITWNTMIIGSVDIVSRGDTLNTPLEDPVMQRAQVPRVTRLNPNQTQSHPRPQSRQPRPLQPRPPQSRPQMPYPQNPQMRPRIPSPLGPRNQQPPQQPLLNLQDVSPQTNPQPLNPVNNSKHPRYSQYQQILNNDYVPKFNPRPSPGGRNHTSLI